MRKETAAAGRFPWWSSMPANPERYREFTKTVEREFQRNRKLHGRKIQCRHGCTDCCHQIFSITEVEAAEISRRMKDLAQGLRDRLAENARCYLPLRTEIFRRHGYIRAWGQLPTPETRLACPALIDGVCAIYEERPVYCRKVGMPLHHPERPGRIFACELNFRRGEVYEDPQLVPNQSATAEDWVQIQAEFDRNGGRREPEPICVADALLNDYEANLPPESSEV